MLHMLFASLHDNDVISEEAFLAWEKSDDPAEAEGKGVAITSTAKFLHWLITEDGDDNGDDDAGDAMSWKEAAWVDAEDADKDFSKKWLAGIASSSASLWRRRKGKFPACVVRVPG